MARSFLHLSWGGGGGSVVHATLLMCLRHAGHGIGEEGGVEQNMTTIRELWEPGVTHRHMHRSHIFEQGIATCTPTARGAAQ